MVREKGLPEGSPITNGPVYPKKVKHQNGVYELSDRRVNPKCKGTWFSLKIVQLFQPPHERLVRLTESIVVSDQTASQTERFVGSKRDKHEVALLLQSLGMTLFLQLLLHSNS